MLHEVQNVQQVPGEHRRRWFFSHEMDLYVWFDDSGHPSALQLSYDKYRQERAIRWKAGLGFGHFHVDDGGSEGFGRATPVLSAGGAFAAATVLERFRVLSAEVPVDVADFVCARLREHPDYSEIRRDGNLTNDPSLLPDRGLDHALELLRSASGIAGKIPATLPNEGIGEIASLNALAGHVFGKAARLGAGVAFAHMDPPTPWITWAVALWNASLNQNLLHESLSPFATEAEATVIRWLGPYFGMRGGHFCAGSSIANLTALWAARDAAGVSKVIASEAAHLSVEKACRLLGLDLIRVPTDSRGRLDHSAARNLEDACLVLTAGTTATGAIDPLELAGQAKWTHVDAAWAGPLRLTPKHACLLGGIERADSVAVSAHKWLFQPKESAMVLFRNPELANTAIGFSGGYLANPNIGLQGSRGAAAIPLLATLLAWGRAGLAERLDFLMAASEQLASVVSSTENLELWGPPSTAVTLFRPTQCPVEDFLACTPKGTFSTCLIGDSLWVRTVAANPAVDMNAILAIVREAANASANRH